MLLHAPTLRVISQSHQRNGVGGEPFIVSLLYWDLEDTRHANPFVAITFPNNPITGEYDRAGAIERTAVLSVPMLAQNNIEFAKGNSWRGSDYLGPAIMDAWERDHNAE